MILTTCLQGHVHLLDHVGNGHELLTLLLNNSPKLRNLGLQRTRSGHRHTVREQLVGSLTAQTRWTLCQGKVCC